MPAVPEKSRTFRIEYPWVFMNTRMYPIHPDDPQAAFRLTPSEKPLDDPFPWHVGFCRACEKRWELRAPWDKLGTVTCPYAEMEKHGHLILVCDDGTAILETPVESTTMLNFVFDSLIAKGTLTELQVEVAKMALRQDTKHLPEEMTPSEKRLVSLGEIENEIENLTWIC